ncbi:MAG: peptidoglycan editing factor PgeF [Alphaproteobacteria bacterium]|nr:peptidoglycan editing factor PgeF [Alphaproteobacteria bacterium]
MRLIAEPLAAAENIQHGFFTRRGGASEGIYASLNCGLGSDDDKARVHENRHRAMRDVGLTEDALRTVYQIHSANVVTVTDRAEDTAATRADALVSKIPGIALGVLAADCAPVLLADVDNGVIGAAHSGWRGAVSGVIEATVEAMAELGADPARMTAVVGPCIGQDSYEVGAEFPVPFQEQNAANDRFFAPGRRAGHLQFDLAGYVLSRLAAAGIAASSALGADTYADEDLFSYRRTCHRGEPDYGRNLSLIALAPPS